MKRIYLSIIESHLKEYRQMVFLAGPRQVGKTTCAKEIKSSVNEFHYLNWDNSVDRKLILKGAHAIAEYAHLDQAQKKLPLIVLDEVHKYTKWKQFLKGFFDHYESSCRILVTGSAKLDVYRRGGDSMMGRYFLYRIHPLSVGELCSTELRKSEIVKPRMLSQKTFDQLFHFGGFPEPFSKANKHFSTNWQRLRKQQLLQEDIRQMSQIQEFAELEYLLELLVDEAGKQLNISSIANHLNVAETTVHRWVKTLSAFYYCFTIKPWHKNIRKAIRKTPKLYLWDWSVISDEGARCENFVASHLHKAVHYWTDLGFGTYELFYIRDRNKREVDFLVTKDKKPWFLVEVKKSNNQNISQNLHYFSQELNIPHAFQAVFDLPFVEIDCFSYEKPIIVPVSTLLSQLV